MHSADDEDVRKQQNIMLIDGGVGEGEGSGPTLTMIDANSWALPFHFYLISFIIFHLYFFQFQPFPPHFYPFSTTYLKRGKDELKFPIK